MFNFEGRHKRRRNINLGGVTSTGDKDLLIKRTVEERLQREQDRIRNKSATRIQAIYRGRINRRIIKGQYRRDWDNQISNWLSSSDYIKTRVKTLLFFYEDVHDQERLAKTLIDLLQKGREKPIFSELLQDNDSASWKWLLRRLSKTSLQLLASSTDISMQTIVWLLSVTSPPQYSDGSIALEVLQCLIECGLYDHVKRHILSIAPENKQNPTLPLIVELAMKPFSIFPKSSPTYAISLRDFALHVFSIPLLPNRLAIQTITKMTPSLPFDPLVLVLYSIQDFQEANEAIATLTNVVAFGNGRVSRMSKEVLYAYLGIMGRLITRASRILMASTRKSFEFSEAGELLDEDSDGDDENVDINPEEPNSRKDVQMVEPLHPSLQKWLDILTSRKHITTIANASKSIPGSLSTCFSEFVCALIYRWKPDQKNDILISLAPVLYQLFEIVNQQIINADRILWTGKPKESGLRSTGLMTNGIDPVKFQTFAGKWDTVVLMCEVYSRILLTMGDDEFFGDKKEEDGRSNFLTLDDIITLSSFLRNVTFTLYWNPSTFPPENRLPGSAFLQNWELCSVTTRLLQQIHARDSRRSFTPAGHWLVTDSFEATSFVQAVAADEKEKSNDAYSNERAVTTSMHQNSVKSRRKLITSPRLNILNNIPFVIPFEDRVTIFRHFVAMDQANQVNAPVNESEFFFRRARQRATVHRGRVFEDGYAHLNALGPALKGPIEITFIDQHGLPEAGIDGGGVFKEFLTSLTKEAFDVNYGLFLSSQDQLLYPNPHAYARESGQLAYFEFLGRILGKALYEGILVDAAFAGFFLNKWLGRSSFLDDLPSLDKDLYQGLMSLKNYRGDVETDLSLNFTVVDNEFGESKVVDLIPNGRNVPVTRENRLWYIYLMANYRLNVQIEPQCRAFYRGLADLIDQKWIRMFNQQELQILIGGAQMPIDVEDLRRHTTYSGAYVSGENHPTIQAFWEVISSLSEDDKRKVIKFATSCARPPLLGFQELNPTFTLRDAGSDENRLPTASTCMNLLKLPVYRSAKALKKKLLYAINAGSGFDLS